MSIPSTYDTGFARSEITGKSDVQDLVDAVNTMLTSTLAVADRWTSLGSGEYKAPVDAYGRTMYVVVTKVSTTRMQFLAKDHKGSTIYNGTIDFATSYTARVWAGPGHLVVEMEYGSTTFESAGVVMSDPLPFDPSTVGIYVMAWTRRNSSGTNVSDDFDKGVCLDGKAADGPVGRLALFHSGDSGNAVKGNTEGGSQVVLPAELCIDLGGWRSSGRLYQLAVVPSGVSAKALITVPLDVGVTGIFEVLGRAEGTGQTCGRLAVRKA